MIAALLASHAGAIWRHVKRIVLFGTALAVAVLVGLIYFIVFLTHVLALLIGTTAALAVMALLAAFVCLLFLRALRMEGRRLAAANRKHVEEERLAVRAAGIEAVAASKLSASIAAVSASLAAAIVLILRQLGPRPERHPEAGAPGTASGEPPPEP